MVHSDFSVLQNCIGRSIAELPLERQIFPVQDTFLYYWNTHKTPVTTNVLTPRLHIFTDIFYMR